MDAHLIFYCANQVYNNESTIVNGLKAAKINTSNISAAFTPQELADTVKNSVKTEKFILICLNISKYKEKVKEIISDTLKDNYSVKSDKKLSMGGDILESRLSTIVILPDNPEDISKILEYDLFDYISENYKINISKKEENIINNNDLIRNINDDLKNYDFNNDSEILSADNQPIKRKFVQKLKDNIGIIFLVTGIVMLAVIIVLAILGNI